MNKKQAKILWNSLTNEQKMQFNDMLHQMQQGKLLMKNVMVDDNEQIQRIILEPKDKPSQPTAPFAKHFHLEK